MSEIIRRWQRASWLMQSRQLSLWRDGLALSALRNSSCNGGSRRRTGESAGASACARTFERGAGGPGCHCSVEPDTDADAASLSRWVDMQTGLARARFKFLETSTGTVTNDQLQHSEQIKDA